MTDMRQPKELVLMLTNVMMTLVMILNGALTLKVIKTYFSNHQETENEPLIISAGSYVCDCLDSFIKDPKSKDCVCADGYEASEGACVDVDECEADPCGDNQVSEVT